jgi:methionyl aminopeptidase
VSQFQIFNTQQIESLYKGGEILRDCLQYVSDLAKEGVTTNALNEAAEVFILDNGALPGFKGYKGYPATLCTSINEECVHGLPGNRSLKKGDIISIDCGVLFDDLYTDACITVGIGEISQKAQSLLDVTKDALKNALGIIRAGIHVGDISFVIQHTVESHGFTPLKSLTGHGLGYSLHQFPDIPNRGRKGSGPIIPNQTVLAIEPIISIGKNMEVQESGDNWTLITADGELCAHFEHTILVTEEGCDIIV